MKHLATFLTLLAVGSAAQAETVRSQTYEATIERRAVSLRAQDGNGAIAAQQVLVSVGRIDGQAATDAAFGFAEKVACGGAVPVVSIALGAAEGRISYDILCRTGG
ncbi:hypothetical protein G5B38_00500 [Pseudohalocynthiibacter aestuariivivens]|nr:hypothetical protein [Pseudohalocynthiibacter aestuariivivens]QIE44126.1 hypothetical protein G5B38_00500 [Pseudohalocynthiibacter aestuariivivens]